MKTTSVHSTARRLVAGVAIYSALLAGTAYAQPVEDPGMPAETQPPPGAPATTISGTPRYSETITETVTSGPAAGRETGIQFYDRTATATYGGPIGLLRTMTGDVGNQGSFRLSINFSFFRGSSFLIKGDTNGFGRDHDSRFAGDLTLSYTPWKYLELYASLFNTSNKNTRTDPGRTDPEVILALGDFELGAKGRIPLHRSFNLGIHAGVRFLNGVSGVSFSGKSTNFDVDLIGSLDVRQLNANVPLRFHFNYGYLLDNSDRLFPSGQCALSTGNDACIRSRVVETFAYGIGQQRLRLALAVDVPLLLGPVGLQPFFEYHNEYSLGDGDSVIRGALANDPNVSHSRLTDRLSQYLTVGARLRPVAGLVLTAAVDVGLTSVGFAYGPPTLPWDVVLGLAYAYDPPGRAHTKIITRTITRTPTAPLAAAEGHVRGVVRDASTKKPLSGVLVAYPDQRISLTPQMTADDGTFVSYGLAPGPVWLGVSRDGYEAQKVSVDLRAGVESPVEVLLTARPPAAAMVHVKVMDGTQPVAATVHFTAARGATLEAEPATEGGYQLRLPAGDYAMDAVAAGYLARSQPVTVQSGGVQSVEVQLRKKPKVSHVKIGKGEIVLKGTIHFATSDTGIRPDSQELLDEMVDVLIANPQIHHVRIEGHTDNVGSPAKNLALSKGRAASVLTYLVKQGVEASRLESEGYGASQPLVPNMTAANRARNRRVAFKITE